MEIVYAMIVINIVLFGVVAVIVISYKLDDVIRRAKKKKAWCAE